MNWLVPGRINFFVQKENITTEQTYIQDPFTAQPSERLGLQNFYMEVNEKQEGICGFFSGEKQTELFRDGTEHQGRRVIIHHCCSHWLDKCVAHVSTDCWISFAFSSTSIPSSKNCILKIAWCLAGPRIRNKMLKQNTQTFPLRSWESSLNFNLDLKFQ